jgi:hypothetical protein
VADVPRERLRRTRGQGSGESKVIDTGPYAIVRHPMDASALLLFIGIPLLLGSWLGLVLDVAGFSRRCDNTRHGATVCDMCELFGGPHASMPKGRQQQVPGRIRSRS